MKTYTFQIREFRTKQPIERATSWEAGFQRCIQLWIRSDKKQSYFVEAVEP